MKYAWLLAAGVALISLCGCQDPEMQKALKALNEDARLVNRNVHVKTLVFTQQHRDAVREYEANILNDKNEIVGKATGRRVEGFGTSKPWLEWFDESLEDKAFDPPDNTFKDLYEKTMKADADGDGQVTYEEAIAANPHMMRSVFDYLDRNGDGVISKDDAEYKGPPRRPWGGFGGRGRRGGGPRNNGGPPSGAPPGQAGGGG
jgi:hypothetical protein